MDTKSYSMFERIVIHTLFPLVLLAFGSFMTYKVFVIPTLELITYAKTEGQLISCRKDPFMIKKSRPGRIKSFEISSCKYTYKVEGKTYTGETVTPSQKHNTKSCDFEGKAFRKYSTGETVPVYFKKSDPGTSALFVGWKQTNWILMFGVWILGAFIGLLPIGHAIGLFFAPFTSSD